MAQKRKGTGGQDVDTQKINTPEHTVNPPKEGHHGVTDFFIGDQATEPDTDERNAAKGKRSKARMCRRLNIIMKPNAPQDEERPTPSATVHQPNLLVHKTTTPMKRSAYKSYKSNTAPQKT